MKRDVLKKYNLKNANDLPEHIPVMILKDE